MAASAAFGAGFTTWDGSTGEEQVQTGLDNGTKTAGYWWDYGDAGDGGNSSVEWPVAKGNEFSDGSLQPIIENCGGLCGTAKIDRGSITDYDGFVGVGFNVAGENATNSAKSDPADASSWGGICITYDSDSDVQFELGLGDADADYAFGVPKADLPSGKNITKDLGWADFVMPNWAITDERNKKGEISGADAAKQLVAVKFKIQAKDGSYGFNIKKVGPKGGCGAENSGNGGEGGNGGNNGGNGGNGGNTAIALTGISTAKAILSGRTLSFSGIDNAKVEVVNLQGQVMLKGTASSTASMNLAGLDAGVYMVRIAGKAVNMSQKILVK